MKIIKAQSLTRFSTMTHCLLASLSLQLAILADFCSSNFAIFAVSPIHFWQQFPLNLFSAKWIARKISSQIFARAFNPGNKCFKSTDRVIIAALGYKTETVVRAFSSNGAHDKSLEITCYNYISFLLNFFLKKKLRRTTASTTISDFWRDTPGCTTFSTDRLTRLSRQLVLKWTHIEICPLIGERKITLRSLSCSPLWEAIFMSALQ